MIRGLKIKFVTIIMLIMSLVLIIIFSTVNIVMSQLSSQQNLEQMKNTIRNNGYMMQPDPKRSFFRGEPFKMRLSQNNFSVKLDNQNNIIEIIADRNIDYTEEEIQNLINLALENKNEFGILSTQRFLKEHTNYGKIIVFMDNSVEKNMEDRLVSISISIGFASLVLIFFISLLLSEWAIRPVKISFEKQKQFVADASHELKTPLTVISANIDVLKDEIGNNKWLDYIKTETNRMSELTNNLLYLAKNDSEENFYNIEEFNLSEAVTSSVLPFEYIAFELGKTMDIDISDNIIYKGDENRIKQVVIILLDNAIKNAEENGSIKVSLKNNGNKKVISVFNSGEGISDEDKTKIFERFYRGDSSRARNTGGYGLGLSIAKAIINGHNGKIFVESEKGKGTIFTVVL